MSDKEHDIPVKVVDRRWWVNQDASAGNSAVDTAPSLKPTYVEELERQLAEKDRIAQEYIAKYRQAAAEFEEARLRLRREIGKDLERGRREILTDLLDVVDNLDRAIESTKAAAATDVSAEALRAKADALLQGVEMVRRQFLSKLESLGVTRIEAEGRPFDPGLHEAVSTIPVASAEQDGQIAGVVRHGYKIGNDVLRPASVAVKKHS